MYLSSDILAQALEQEKWNVLSDLLNFMKRPDWRDQALNMNVDMNNAVGLGSTAGLGGTHSSSTLGEKLKIRLLSKRSLVEEVAALHDAAIAGALKPYSAVPSPRPNPSNLLAAVFAPTRYGRFLVSRDQAYVTLTLYRYALRAYRADRGEYPSDLQALVPHYISRPYPDPFGSGTEPLHYRRHGDSYQLWSVGTDGRDNAGVSVPGVRRPNQILITEKQKGDIVVGP
jgi:hypothetical protein